ncbi:unnamed protein product, partial [Closterium sp. NIES-54]
MALAPPVAALPAAGSGSEGEQTSPSLEAAANGSNAVDEPQLILHKMALMSLVAADGYHWLKYGEKVLSKIGDPVSVRRAYYKCGEASGEKGRAGFRCPARKVVDVDPSLPFDPALARITYSHSHNHPPPPTFAGRLRLRTSTAEPSVSKPGGAEPGGAEPGAEPGGAAEPGGGAEDVRMEERGGVGEGDSSTSGSAGDTAADVAATAGVGGGAAAASDVVGSGGGGAAAAAAAGIGID